MAAGQANAAMQMEAGKFNAQLEVMGADFNSEVIQRMTQYNASLIRATTDYNTSLLEDELEMMWEAADLDLALLDNQRSVERGAIEATQAASGTVMGVGSNAEVLIDQKTQADLDAFVVRHNANREAENINIQIQENVFNGQLAWQQTMFKGAMDSYSTRVNAGIRAAGALGNAALGAAGTLGNAAMGAAAIMGETMISGAAQRQSARYAYNSGMAGASMQYNQNKTQISNNLVNGLFGAAAWGAGNYYAMKQTPVSLGFSAKSSVSKSAAQLARANHPAWERVLAGQMSTPGTSLI